jgi:LuxR family maltose regulon positive regulatory protein
MLERLDAANLFIVPLDDERRWYRYHHLFADLLRHRLAHAWPERVPTLHRRASEWYESKGQFVEAVGHALMTGDVEWIERLVAGNALAVIYHGELATVASWFDTLPTEVMRSRPRLCVARAWALAYSGQLDAIEALLRDAERALAGSDARAATPVLSMAEEQHVAGHIAAIRAYVAGLRGDVSRAAALARGALERLPEADPAVRGWTLLLLGCVLRSQGDLPAAAQAFAEAIAISRATGDSHLGIDVLREQAVLQLAQGQLHKAMSTCEEALRIAGRYSRRGGRQLPVTGYTYALMSGVLREWNDLAAALRYAREGLELCKQWGQADALLLCYVPLTRALHAGGETGSALAAIQEARQVAGRLGPWYAATAGALEARMRLMQGDVAAASRWAQESGLGADDELSIDYQVSYLTLARVLMAQRRPDEALGLLARLLKMVEGVGATGPAIGILVLQALVLQAQGKREHALAALERALSLAEPEGYVRAFVDEGAPMGDLLAAALSAQRARRGAAAQRMADYVGRLLAALAAETSAERRVSRPSSVLVEPLSAREMEVLRLLSGGLSNRQIAAELSLAVGTVKKHTANLYGKLNVHNRTHAVARARELGLL